MFQQHLSSFAVSFLTMNTKAPVSLLTSIFLFFLICCVDPSEVATGGFHSNVKLSRPVAKLTGGASVAGPEIAKVAASNMEIMARKQVPILCYHQIRDFRPKDSERAKDYIVPPVKFAEQMKRLSDSGYHTVLPGQLMEHLQYGTALPENPVMIHFDDADLSQFEVAKPILDKYGFKACYFIMTVVLNKPGYMKKEHVKQLSDEGNVIGSHTWDHMNVKKMEEKDWQTQIGKPSRQLAEITGKPVEYFAYPFGLWNHDVASKLGEHGFKAAFQLSEKRDSSLPLYTIRRVIVPGQWETERVFKFMKGSFR